MKFIKVKHANLNTELYVTIQQVAGFYHSPAHKCTHIVSTGGAILPASESVEEIKRLLSLDNITQTGQGPESKEVK